MCSDGFSITWSDHARNVVGVLGRYLDEQSLVDCTIAAEGEFLKAHRLVLSACSTYFELLFGREMKKEKVVVLEDIKFKDLKSLIAFMYQGQITVPKDRLRDFVRAADFLQVKGLPSDLVHNSQREATEMSVGCAKEGLALQLSHEDLGRPARSVQSSHLQWVTSMSMNESGGETQSTYVQRVLLEENVLLQPQSILDSEPNTETTVFPPEKEPPVEPKEEMDVYDTPIWESEEEYTSAETDFSSATAGEGVENELTPVPGTISSSSCFGSSRQNLEKESVTSIAKLSFVTAIVPSSTNTASPSPLVPNVPTEQSGSVMEDCSSIVRSELAEQSICVKTEPVVKTEVILAVVSLHSESVVEPMHEVWVEELRSWESEEGITGIRSIDTCSQEATIRDLGAGGARGNYQPAMKPNGIFKDFPSSLVVAGIEKKHVKAQEVKEETELDKWCTDQKCESVDVIESAGDRVVESGRQSTVQVHNDNLLIGEQEMKERKVMVKALERALETDVAVEQSDAEEDSAPLSERVSKTMGKKLRKCRRCPAVFCTVSELRLHAKNVHKKKRSKRSKRCEVCLATFAYDSHLKIHMRTHIGERSFKCELCEKSFNYSSNLTRHKRVHTCEHSFQCEVCKRAFIHRSYLTTHMRSHTGECPFQCNVCKRPFSHKSHLNTHMRTHTGERPFHCDVCDRSFAVKDTLIKHMLTHTGERPFYCDVCEKSFSVKCTLVTHMRTHTGERPFECNVCKRSFTDRSKLCRHMRTHTDMRPFLCHVCESSFSTKYMLITHMRIHTGESPFQCNVCKRSFSSKNYLIKHMRSHTG